MTDAEHKGVVATVAALGEKAVTLTPPALIMLVLLNVVFLAVQWQQNASRERILSAVIAGCLQRPQ
jgi:hypothetical protein